MNLDLKFAICKLRIALTANIEIIFHNNYIWFLVFTYIVIISSINPYLSYIYCVTFCPFIHFFVNLSYEK